MSARGPKAATWKDSHYLAFTVGAQAGIIAIALLAQYVYDIEAWTSAVIAAMFGVGWYVSLRKQLRREAKYRDLEVRVLLAAGKSWQDQAVASEDVEPYQDTLQYTPDASTPGGITIRGCTIYGEPTWPADHTPAKETQPA